MLSEHHSLKVSDYLKLKSSLGTTETRWDILSRGDVLWGDPHRRAPSTVTHHLSTQKQWRWRYNDCYYSFHIFISYSWVFYYYFNLVRFWRNLLFKTLKHFVVFCFMHGHLLQVRLCETWVGNKKKSLECVVQKEKNMGQGKQCFNLVCLSITYVKSLFPLVSSIVLSNQM